MSITASAAFYRGGHGCAVSTGEAGSGIVPAATSFRNAEGGMPQKAIIQAAVEVKAHEVSLSPGVSIGIVQKACICQR